MLSVSEEIRSKEMVKSEDQKQKCPVLVPVSSINPSTALRLSIRFATQGIAQGDGIQNPVPNVRN